MDRPSLRLRVVAAHPALELSGLDDAGARAVAPGESLVIGREAAGIRVRDGGGAALGGRRSYIVSGKLDGELTIQHTGHAGRMRVNDVEVPFSRLTAGDVVELITTTGELGLRLVCE